MPVHIIKLTLKGYSDYPSPSCSESILVVLLRFVHDDDNYIPMVKVYLQIKICIQVTCRIIHTMMKDYNHHILLIVIPIL